MNLKLLVASAAVLFAIPCFAAGVDRRACHQQARIYDGVRSGELTPHETYRLERREAHLQNEMARDRADGRGLNLRERARIQHQENRISRDIYRQKHDLQER
jgi:hypothetical protein